MDAFPPQDDTQSELKASHDALARLLHEVPLPEDLEGRILLRLQTPHVVAPSATRIWARREWLSGLAVGLGGLLAGGTAYAWYRRPLTINEVQQVVLTSLKQRNWITTWNTLPRERAIDEIPVPREFRSHGWQYRNTLLDARTIAHDVSGQGCLAVLFAMRTHRDISQFSNQPPSSPIPQSGEIWNSLAVWRHQRHILYALALQGSGQDYRRLQTRTEASPLA